MALSGGVALLEEVGTVGMGSETLLLHAWKAMLSCLHSEQDAPLVPHLPGFCCASYYDNGLNLRPSGQPQLNVVLYETRLALGVSLQQ